MSNIISLTERLKKQNQLDAKPTPMNKYDEFEPVSCSAYIVEGDAIVYTKTGYPYYKGLFAQVGIAIDKVTNKDALKKALQKSEHVEIEYASDYGSSPDADLESQWFHAITNSDFEEADRLGALLDRKQNLKVV